MATFTYIPSYSATESSQPRVRTFKAGDGYEQRVKFGLRTDPKVWQLTFSERTDTEAGGILAFLEARAGAESFDWTPPQRLGGNRLLWSEGFDNAVWERSFLSITPNTTTAPNGSLTADKIFENTTTATNHFITQRLTTASGQYVLSIYAKAAERSQLEMQLGDYVGSGAGAVFDISSGLSLSSFTYGPAFAGVSYSITNAGSGWFRACVSVNKSYSGGELAAILQPYKDNTYSYAGAIGSGLLVWGAQLEIGSTPSTYTSTTTSAAGVVAAGKFVCEEWDATMRSANFNNITATFRQVFEA